MWTQGVLEAIVRRSLFQSTVSSFRARERRLRPPLATAARDRRSPYLIVSRVNSRLLLRHKLRILPLRIELNFLLLTN